MALTDFWTRNYRSIKDVWLKLDRISVIVGPNGSGKSNLYRAMYLVASSATGRLARSIAEEGGMPSILWSGRYGKKEKSSRVDFSVRFNDMQYDLTCGVIPPQFQRRFFHSDLEIKRERLYLLNDGSKSLVLDRGRAEAQVRDQNGKMVDYTMQIPINESILSSLREPYKYPRLSDAREELLRWRFYHHFRTDRHSPLRKPQYPTFTPLMAHDGSDFVSALASIEVSGNWEELEQCIEDAFPGAAIWIEETSRGLRLKMQAPGFRRPFDASEISDGTLQYLCLLTALFSLDPPTLLVINEPETSIHPDLFEPLARLFIRASENSQIWITTHSRDLADYIIEYSGYSPLELEKVEGETRLVGVGLGGYRESEEDDAEEDAEILQ